MEVALTVTVGYHPETGEAVEVFFTGRGKYGTALHELLYDIGVFISKEIQGEPSD